MHISTMDRMLIISTIGVFAILSTPSLAQITIDAPEARDRLTLIPRTNYTATAPEQLNALFAQEGPEQVFDLRVADFEPVNTFDVLYVPPFESTLQTIVDASQGPSANEVIRQKDADGSLRYTVYESSTTGLIQVAIYEDLVIDGKRLYRFSVNEPPHLLHPYPLTSESTWEQVGLLRIVTTREGEVTGNVQLRRERAFVDSWGRLITDEGDDECLRIRRTATFSLVLTDGKGVVQVDSSNTIIELGLIQTVGRLEFLCSGGTTAAFNVTTSSAGRQVRAFYTAPNVSATHVETATWAEIKMGGQSELLSGQED